MSSLTHDVDCLVIGAGISGLWLRALLSRNGYSTLTVERSAAGDGQTIASQGILHRGLKYQLSPAAARAASELAAAQSGWEDALAGRGPVDLRSTRTLASTMHMWATPGGVGGILAKITASMASASFTSAAQRLTISNRPASFAGAHADTPIYEVQERCVDVASLLETLLRATGAATLVAAPTAMRTHPDGVDVTLSDTSVVRASCVFACAGEGNEAIGGLLGLQAGTIMQRRPLKMVAMRNAPFELNGHCIQPMSDKPRITVTTTRHEGVLYWWLGGELAEAGVARDDGAQITAARSLLAECIPWADLSLAQFANFEINRAEGRTTDGRRPDGPVVRDMGRVMLAWPTKLALAPVLALDLLERVKRLGVPARGAKEDGVKVPVARVPWMTEHARWI